MEGLLLNHGEKFRLPCPGRNRRKRECLQVYRHRQTFFWVYEQLLVVAVARYHTNTANTKKVEKRYRSFYLSVV